MKQETGNKAAKRGLTPVMPDKRGSDPARRPAAGIAMPEIMLIISLVVILAMLAYPRYYDSMTKASRDGALVASDALIKATAMYQLDKRVYPDSLADIADYTNTTSLKNAYRTLTVESSTSCVHGVVSGIGSESQKEAYHIFSCASLAGMSPGGYCCMSPNKKTGAADCALSYSPITSVMAAANWHECKKGLY